jgi:hypothetical protein
MEAFRRREAASWSTGGARAELLRCRDKRFYALAYGRRCIQLRIVVEAIDSFATAAQLLLVDRPGAPSPVPVVAVVLCNIVPKGSK